MRLNGVVGLAPMDEGVAGVGQAVEDSIVNSFVAQSSVEEDAVVI
jgi:hypothetical protein